MDSALRLQLLRAAVRDRIFLKQAWHDISADDFPEQHETTVAKVALNFYAKYDEPIGSMLRTHALEQAQEDRLGSEAKKQLGVLLDSIQSGNLEPVSVKALVDRAKKLKKDRFYRDAVEEIISAHEEGNLTTTVLAELVDKAAKQLHDTGDASRDYLSGLDARIARRKMWDVRHKYPRLLIDPIDAKICAIGRGHLGIFLAPFASGKGMALLHVATAYALQGLKVLVITLEDPIDEVENRLDAQLTGIAMAKLRSLPKTLRRLYAIKRKQMHGNIKIIDGTEGGWTVERIERAWVREAQNNFVADAIIVDYDDELEPSRQHKGESARRMEFADMYRAMRKLAAKLNVIFWTAAQGTRGAEGKRILTGKDVAEDVSKVRKAFLAIGIGVDPEDRDKKYLYVIRHRLDRSRFGVEIFSDFGSAIFYDRERTLKYIRQRRK